MPNPNQKVEAIYPLSPMQEGMLFHSLLHPDSSVYLDQLCLTLQGTLNTSAFQKAWQQVIARHPILRTLFKWERNDKPLQIVLHQVKLPWEQFDRHDLPVSNQEEWKTWLENWLRTDRLRGFDFSQAPLMRLTLFQIAADTNYFVWSSHHILLDGWSTSQVLQEVFAYYYAYCQGHEIKLDIPRSYREYIAWLQKQDQKQAETFWRQTLHGFTTPIHLPIGKLSTPVIAPSSSDSIVEADYSTRVLSLSAQETQTLQTFARQNQVTLNTLVQAAWAILLSRYTGQNDIVFGVTVAGRPTDLSGFDKMVGLFINTLPVRFHVYPHVQLKSWLTELQHQMIMMRQYEYCRLVDIQSWSEIPRGQALFENILVFENYPLSDLIKTQPTTNLPDTLEPHNTVQIAAVERSGMTNYPLTLACEPGNELKLMAIYDRTYFDNAPWNIDDTIVRLLHHLKTILEGMAARPDQTLANIPMLTPQEKKCILVEWNNTQHDFPYDQCIHQLFEAQANRSPDATALIFASQAGGYIQSLTYQELNARANQLAHYLQKQGVGPDTIVAISIQRSIEMVVAILGVLKAGGAYVPLDPFYPKDRLAFMLSDSGAVILLTQENLVTALPAQNIRNILIDANWDKIASESDQSPNHEVAIEDLAYVIYTSGSTGMPKGVLVTHRGIPNMCLAHCRLTGVDAYSRVLQFSSFSFDASVLEIFPVLTVGGTLVLAPKEDLTPGEPLLSTLRSQAITNITLTPSVLSVLDENKLPVLRGIVSAGEACTQELAVRWSKGRHFFNAYGPTETTVWATLAEYPNKDEKITIGRPIDNVRVYILDDQLHPVPVGIPGEIHIGGIGVARGYLNQSKLTSEKFILDPFQDDLETYIYKSGDLARYLPSGNIEFLGRKDSQVKIRGFRVELGEIEATLRQHPMLQDVVAAAREDKPGNKIVVAYFVSLPESSPSLNELRDFLKVKLPEHMLPSAFVKLDAIPLNPSGKVNYRALPSPQILGVRPEQVYISPRTPTETLIAQIWAEILGIDCVGSEDNFFDLGGHSLLVMRVIALLRDRLGIELPLRSMFETPTVSDLAKRVETIRWAQQHSQASSGSLSNADDREEISL